MDGGVCRRWLVDVGVCVGDGVGVGDGVVDVVVCRRWGCTSASVSAMASASAMVGGGCVGDGVGVSDVVVDVVVCRRWSASAMVGRRRRLSFKSYILQTLFFRIVNAH